LNWFIQALKKYADFKGRARRKEFWMDILFYIIIMVVLGIVDGIIGASMGGGIGILTLIYLLAMLVPTLAVTVRRLHDIGKSGWWYFITLVPLIGGIWLIVLLVTDSQPGTNAWGPNPKAGEVPPAA
jgi:uncharacterized membrane protein YhaH (DUF805 family)